MTDSNGIVDLRSDTVTKPSAAMRRAMADAEVGDDGSGEDPTVNLLEQTFAERVGKEAAVFVPSGTMGNQIALRLLGVPGTAVVAGRSQHVVAFENGAAAMNASVQWHTVDDSRGELGFSDVKLAVELADHHQVPVERGVRGEHAHGELGKPVGRRRPRRDRRARSPGAPRRRSALQRRGRDGSHRRAIRAVRRRR